MSLSKPASTPIAHAVRHSIVLILLLAQLVAAPATVLARELGDARPDTLARVTLDAPGTWAEGGGLPEGTSLQHDPADAGAAPHRALVVVVAAAHPAPSRKALRPRVRAGPTRRPPGPAAGV